MIIISKKILILFVLYLGAMISLVPKFSINVSANNQEIIKLSNYTDLPYIDNGNVKIEFKLYDENFKKDLYDIYFYYENKVYIMGNVTMPPIYYKDKNYSINYRVELIDNIKRVFLNFLDSENFKIEYELTTGNYKANDKFKIETKNVKKEFISKGGYYEYWLYFNVNIPMDIIYQIDITYRYTEKALFWTIVNKQVTLEVLRKTNYKDHIFGKFYSSIFGTEEKFSIVESDDEKYQWKAYLQPAQPWSEIKDALIIEMYYVTNGVYYQQKPEDTPTDEFENLCDTLCKVEKFWNYVEKAINWFKNPKNFERVIFIVIAFFVTMILGAVLPVVLTIFTILFKSILFTFKIALFFIMLPFKILSSLGSKSKKMKYKVRY